MTAEKEALELMLKQKEIQRDKHKVLIEYLKFLTTLSTGSIVLLTSFLERLAPQPNQEHLISISLVGFMVCIVASVITYTSTLFLYGKNATEGELVIPVIMIVITWGSFIIAIVALTLFGLANL